ncbi:cytochrome P450 [Exophiala viscosa]|uniref:Cytochrome P450 n=1 Tax=Exophiala viscosa TaxID=2486360 RepID=A0AAN6DNG0_9EURO|nr:cytochrome P450 [Exophiala viscosa]
MRKTSGLIAIMFTEQATSVFPRRLQTLAHQAFGNGVVEIDRSRYAASFLAVAIVAYIIYQTFIHPLAKFPGPVSARYVPYWRNTRYWRGTWHEDILDVHRRYGRVVRIAPNELSIVDGEAMKHLYGHGTSSTKTQWYATWDPPIPDAVAFFSARDRKIHAFQRKRVSGAYAMSSILRYEQFIQQSLDELLLKFAKYATADNKVDLAKWTNAFAFDVVGQLGFGAPLGHVKTESDVMNLRRIIFDMFYMSAGMGHYYWGIKGYYWGQMKIFTNKFTTSLLELLGQKNDIVEFNVWGVARVKSRMDAEKRGEKGRPDMLAHFLNMKRADGSPAKFNEVLAEALNLVGAGADTTSIAMRACVHAICLRPQVYRRLQAEIDDYYVANDLKSGITYHQTQSLPYLVAVCKEAMRLLPSIVFQLLRHVPAEGMYVGKHYIPGGSEVGISPMAQNRDQDIWGPDADDFRPERWLESEERTRFLDSYNMTFGGNGPRMCVGKNIALVSSIPNTN